MPLLRRVALLGDRSSSIPAHVAIDACFASQEAGALEGVWISPAQLRSRAFPSDFAGIWCTPGSPYSDTQAVLQALRVARENDLLFLGTCGGFQHLLLERFHNIGGRRDLGHEEQDPAGGEYLIHRLVCSLVEKDRSIRACPGSLYETLCGSLPREERFRCSYGLNPHFFSQLADVGLRASAVDEDGNVRAVEALPGARFCLATLFQPERSIDAGVIHPLVQAFFKALSSLPPRT